MKGYSPIRMVILGLVFLLGALIYYTPQLPTPIPFRPELSGWREKMTLRELQKNVRRPYAIAPDKRFLIAIGVVNEIFTGKSAKPTAAWLDEGFWEISLANEPIGKVKDALSFAEMLDFLQKQARLLQDRHANIFTSQISPKILNTLEQAIHDFTADRLFQALNKINELWQAGSKDKTLITLSSHALSRLTLQWTDRMEMGDILSGTALGFVAVSRVLEGKDIKDDELLVALAMGYETHLAKDLESANPLIAGFLNGNKDLLVQSARDQNDPLARYLSLLVNLEDANEKEWFELRDEFYPEVEPSLPTLRAGLELNTFGANASLPGAIVEQTLLELARHGGRMSGWVEDLSKIIMYDQSSEDALRFGRVLRGITGTAGFSAIEGFEEMATGLSSTKPGVLVQPAVVTAYFRGLFYSGLSTLGLHYIDTLKSDHAANRFQVYIGEGKSGISGELRIWYRHVVNFETGQGDPKELWSDLDKLTTIGATPLFRLVSKMSLNNWYAEPLMRAISRELFARSDARPAHLFRLAQWKHDVLLDLDGTEELLKRLSSCAGKQFGEYVVWLASLNGEIPVIRKYAAGPQNIRTRLYAVKVLESAKEVSEEEIERYYETLRMQYPAAWNVVDQYGEYLFDNEKWEAARKIYTDWLTLRIATSGIEGDIAVYQVARSFYEESNYEQALKTLEPYLFYSSGKINRKSLSSSPGHISCRAAKILFALNRRDEAIEVARIGFSRYPNSTYQLEVLLELLWAGGRFEEAAQQLGTFLRQYTISVPASFLNAFTAGMAKQSDESVLTAFDLIVAKLAKGYWFPRNISEFARVMSEAGRAELAWKFIDRVKVPGFHGMGLAIEGYAYYRQVLGEEKAKEWLLSFTEGMDRTQATFLILRTKKKELYHLLWSFVPNPIGSEDPYKVWLGRAVGYLWGEGAPSHSKELQAHFAASEGDYYHLFGRYLLGLATESEILDQKFDATLQTVAAFYLGAKAQAECRLKDASEWYQISSDVGMIGNAELLLSLDALYGFSRTGVSLSRITCEKTFPKEEP